MMELLTGLIPSRSIPGALLTVRVKIIISNSAAIKIKSSQHVLTPRNGTHPVLNAVQQRRSLLEPCWSVGDSDI